MTLVCVKLTEASQHISFKLWPFYAYICICTCSPDKCVKYIHQIYCQKKKKPIFSSLSLNHPGFLQNQIFPIWSRVPGGLQTAGTNEVPRSQSCQELLVDLLLPVFLWSNLSCLGYFVQLLITPSFWVCHCDPLRAHTWGSVEDFQVWLCESE